jgi:hypothetical protein
VTTQGHFHDRTGDGVSATHLAFANAQLPARESEMRAANNDRASKWAAHLSASYDRQANRCT